MINIVYPVLTKASKRSPPVAIRSWVFAVRASVTEKKQRISIGGRPCPLLDPGAHFGAHQLPRPPPGLSITTQHHHHLHPTMRTMFNIDSIFIQLGPTCWSLASWPSWPPSCLMLVELSILPILDPLRCLYSLYSYKMHNRYSPDMEVPSPSFGRSNQSVIQKRFVHFPSMRFNISWAVAFVSK